MNEVTTSDVQALMLESDQEMKFDQEASLADMKNTQTGELRSVGGSSNVSKESLVGASAANSVREMQSSVRTIVAYIEWVYSTTFDPGSAISTWTLEIVGRVVSRSRSSFPDVRTACERRKRKNCRKALVQLDGLVMLMMIEKPKDKGKIQNCTGVNLDLVDRSDGAVVDMIVRVVKARVVYRMLEEQRGDARDKSISGVPYQQTSAERTEGKPVKSACVASVRPTGTVTEPRGNKARWFCVKREAKLAECGFSKDCEGCRVAASGDEVLRPHGKECR